MKTPFGLEAPAGAEAYAYFRGEAKRLRDAEHGIAKMTRDLIAHRMDAYWAGVAVRVALATSRAMTRALLDSRPLWRCVCGHSWRGHGRTCHRCGRWR